MAHILKLVTNKSCHHCDSKFLVIEVRGIEYYHCRACGCTTKK